MVLVNTATLFKMLRWPSWSILRYTDPKLCGAWCRHNKLIWNHFCDGDYLDAEDFKRRRFREHCEYVRRVVPAERLIEYDISQGWTPITKFLGLPDYTGTIVRNGGVEFVEGRKSAWQMMLVTSAIIVGKGVIISSAAIGFLLYYERTSWKPRFH